MIRSLFVTYRALRHYPPFNPWKAAWHLFLASWLALIPHCRELRRKRQPVCQKCKLYSHLHKTCGHMRSITGNHVTDIQNGVAWINPQTGIVEPFGCGCYLPVKTLIPNAQCFLRSRGSDVGWPDEING